MFVEKRCSALSANLQSHLKLVPDIDVKENWLILFHKCFILALYV